MRKYSVTAIARHRLAHARSAPSGRSAETVYGGHEHRLRQTLIALTPGTRFGDVSIHGEATMYIVCGRVRLTCADSHVDAAAGDLVTITAAPRPRVEALVEPVLVLTVAKLR
ncbi:LuxR family transcriptional regulator [Aldersonia sp. NBC_00410]|uniref:LuxR family transcriptional regulator n=1 Tax=Aldersonia sp. NBC_00410 TaxID=2975954 RepID=UPI002256B727|nr:LuxR family transcriptional regulator [Aldersonia sp. NBC_00410]MCX5044058.1 LuxR family transcriptional regulator [Aldersonia sp. NBC_00410]